MRKIHCFDVKNLSLKDIDKFWKFVKLNNDKDPKEIVDTWNKYAKNIYQHVFYKCVNVI